MSTDTQTVESTESTQASAVETQSNEFFNTLKVSAKEGLKDSAKDSVKGFSFLTGAIAALELFL